MDAITHMIQEIEQKAAHKREQLRKVRQTTLKEDFAQQKEMILFQHQQRVQKQQEYLRRDFRQRQTQQNRDFQQQVLIEKQALLKNLFEEAYQKMISWGDDELFTFIVSAAKSLPIQETAVLRLSKSLDTVFRKADRLFEINQQLSYSLELGEGMSVNQAGFIIEHEGVIYNFLYRDLLEEVRMADLYLWESLFTEGD